MSQRQLLSYNSPQFYFHISQLELFNKIKDEYKKKEFGENYYLWNLENGIRHIPVREQIKDGCIEVGGERSCVGQSELWVIRDRKQCGSTSVHSSIVLSSRLLAH